MKFLLASASVVAAVVTITVFAVDPPLPPAQTVASAAPQALHDTKGEGVVDQDCAALQQNPDDPQLACEAVRCATGQDPYWSRCPAGGEGHEGR